MYLKISISMLALIACVFVSCDKTEDPPVNNPDDFFVFGRFYGECLGEECIEIFKLQDGKLFEDRNDQYVSNESFYVADFQALDDSKYEAVKDLWSFIPGAIYEEDQVRFGCPDCADQGGLYLEIRTGAFHEYWILDQNKNEVPQYLHSLMDAVNLRIDLINNQ